jgi:bifunctional N-acetylglucosamine-1-phosphate-uridyltransferase/glucosamine-1-phosphate-acetyltransferase GlmU-like protein
MTDLIIVAAGNGTRMGVSTPKVLFPLHGEPNLDRTLRIAKQSETFSRIKVVVSEGSLNHFDPYKNDVELIPIKSGWGDGHALISALSKSYSFGPAVIIWGDAVLLDDGIFRELSYKNIKNSPFIIPGVYEDDPYVCFEHNYQMQVKHTLFSKYNERRAFGIHDQSIFKVNAEIIFRALMQAHDFLWKDDRYITENSELNLLNLTHYLWNVDRPAIVYETKHPTYSFNTIEEALKIETNI